MGLTTSDVVQDNGRISTADIPATVFRLRRDVNKIINGFPVLNELEENGGKILAVIDNALYAEQQMEKFREEMSAFKRRMDSLLVRAEGILERAKLFEKEKNKTGEGAAVAEPTQPLPPPTKSEEGESMAVIDPPTPSPVSKPKRGGINIAAILTKRR